MCTGLEIAAIGSALLGAAGTVASGVSAQKSAEAQAKARNRVLSQTQEKNRLLAEEANAALQRRLAQEDATPQEAAQPFQERRQDTTSAVLDRASTGAPIQLSGNAPRVVANEAANAQSATDSAARRRAGDLAGLRSFGDLLFDKGLSSNDARRNIGLVSGLAAANTAQLPVLQDLAQTKAASKGGALGQIGQILSAVGSVGAAAAGSGALSGFGGAGVTTQANNPFGPSLFDVNGKVLLPTNLGL